MADESVAWRSYEEVATYLLNQIASTLGLERVEGKQALRGAVTDWEVDAKGVREGGTGFVVIECRRYTISRLKQGHLAALAYSIRDTGADSGIVVTPCGLQEGAERIAAAENIQMVRLDADSTTTSYVLEFLGNVMIGVPAIEAKVHVRLDGSVEVTSNGKELIVVTADEIPVHEIGCRCIWCLITGSAPTS
ncbi:restriction endonuclease [Nocardia inohanensis]|uniref:restriction endonuclease n=1 Tax=Nocardia inohanensis TaxID=209246 RepID=UPI0008353D79|nr:restriction endonuclease [Nocardia inohanensis]